MSLFTDFKKYGGGGGEINNENDMVFLHFLINILKTGDSKS